MSRQLRHKWQGQMFFLQKLSWEVYGFKFLLLNFQGTFPTLQNKTSNFKLPASVTPLAKRTYTGKIANTTVHEMWSCLKVETSVFSSLT